MVVVLNDEKQETRMATKEKIEERRRQVWDLVVRGTPMAVMAGALGVHRNTVLNDLSVLRERHRELIADVDVETEIGDAVAKYDDLFQLALQQYHMTDKDGAKGQLLGNALQALSQKVRFLVEVGVLPKAVQEVTAKLIVEGVDLEKASLDELYGLRTRLIERAGLS